MTVEDAIERLAHHINRGLFTIEMKDDWAFKFVANVSDYTLQNKPLSTEQAKIILKIVRRTRDYLIKHGESQESIDALLLSPQYRLTPYPSANVPREVRFLGDNLLGFRFKRNDAISQSIGGLVNHPADEGAVHLGSIWFHREFRLWVVPVNRRNLDDVMEVIREHRFAFDDDVVEYLTLCANNRGRPAAFAADTDLGVIAGQVYDCEIIAWWSRSVLGGSLA